MEREVVERIAKTHDIGDIETLTNAIDRARREFSDALWNGWPGLPDELDEVVKIGDQLDELLDDFYRAVFRKPYYLGLLAEKLVEAEGGTLYEKATGLFDFCTSIKDELRPRIRKIRDAAAAGHVKRKQGRLRAGPLYQATRVLAAYWITELDRPFTNQWIHRGQEPISPAARFVRDVMASVDPTRIPELPTVMKNVVASHRRTPFSDKTGPRDE
jgi:hypothetical protein